MAQLGRQLVLRVLDDDHSGRAEVDVNRDRPVPVGMVPVRATHVVIGNVVLVRVIPVRGDLRIYDVVARRARRNMQPVSVQVDHVEVVGTLWNRTVPGVDQLGRHVVNQQDAQRVSSAHAERRPWRMRAVDIHDFSNFKCWAVFSRRVEAQHVKSSIQAGAFLGDRDVAEHQRDAQRAVAGLHVARARGGRVGRPPLHLARVLVRLLKIDAAADAEELDQKEHAPQSHVGQAHHHCGFWARATTGKSEREGQDGRGHMGVVAGSWIAAGVVKLAMVCPPPNPYPNPNPNANPNPEGADPNPEGAEGERTSR
eukprot:scaffold124349_cov57-Phaeocystis_antarctica.AAC.3